MAFASEFQNLAVNYAPDWDVDDMAIEWTKRLVSKGVIDKSGAKLIPWWTDPDIHLDDELFKAYSILENWRASHGLPLNVIQRALRGRAQRIETDVLVAQRLKRTSSIMNKLVREPTMKLSQMHDLGGCRAILSSVKAVRKLYGMYDDANTPLLPGEGSLRCYDYIDNPKDDGYRGIHVVARYHPHIASRAPWDGQRIEIQLRTKLQHAFATAVETVTTFTREPLKFGAGPEEWRRFFALMGSALAVQEETQLVSGTPTVKVELVAELRDATDRLRVRQRLQTWADALQVLPRRHTRHFKYLLLALDTTNNTFRVTGYQDRKQAEEAVAEIEKAKRKDLDVVLVWVSSIRRLRVAYPNYYADTKEFLRALDTTLAL